MSTTKRFLQSNVDGAVTLEKLKTAFAAFRRANKPGTHIPDVLRAQVASALGQGVPGGQIQKLCRLSWIQVKKIKSDGIVPHAISTQSPRVLSVIDEKALSLTRSEAVEIGIGSWRVSVTRTA